MLKRVGGVAGNARPVRKGWRYRANVGARVVAATIGAYGIAALFAMAMARILPMPRLEAVLLATLASCLVFPAISIWAFLARGPWRAWGGIAGAGLILYATFQLAGAPA